MAKGHAAFPTRPGSPPSLLLTLLGDYWWGRKELLPSGALVDLLADFDVSDVSARAALSRLVKRGLLHSTRHGRNTFYGLTERATAVLNEGASRLLAFGSDAEAWSGQWSLIAFSVPESARAVRERLRTRLRWLGFAPLYDGLWVCPHNHGGEALSELAHMGILTATAFQAETHELTPKTALPQSAWDWNELAALYHSFLKRVEQLRTELLSGSMSPAAALVHRTRLMDEWRTFPILDPEVPLELLPPDWARPVARRLFFETYDALGVPAADHVRSVLVRYAPDIGRLARPHRLDAPADVH